MYIEELDRIKAGFQTLAVGDNATLIRLHGELLNVINGAISEKSTRERYAADIDRVRFTPMRLQVIDVYSGYGGPSSQELNQAWELGRSTMLALIEAIQHHLKLASSVDERNAVAQPNIDARRALTLITNRFDLIAKQLRQRHDDRATLDVNDEYDLQDLLHGLLRLYFDDVRPEEWTPSYAGKSSRMDFLLKSEQVVIETKMGRRGLTHSNLGDELIVDIERYSRHPDCKELWCFVYDPEGHVRNPRGIENDLSRKAADLGIRVVIRPKFAS